MAEEPPPFDMPPVGPEDGLEEAGIGMEKPGKLARIMVLVSVICLVVALVVMILPAMDKPLPSILKSVVNIVGGGGEAP